jgi:hypothetical protein
MRAAFAVSLQETPVLLGLYRDLLIDPPGGKGGGACFFSGNSSGSGSGSGSGYVAVAGMDWMCQCGHFDRWQVENRSKIGGN